MKSLLLSLLLLSGLTARAAEIKKPTPSNLGKIAFVLFRPHNGNRIYVMNADGTNRTLLTDEEAHSPCFSPDGKQITYVGWEAPNTTPRICLIDADGNHAKELNGVTYMEFSKYGDPFISPDETQIVFAGGNGNEEIDRVNADGKGLTTLAGSELHGGEHIYARNFSPSYSSDGKHIVFVSDREFSSWGSSNEIYIMDADGANQTRITKNDDDDGSPCFSPDGKQIAFTSVRAGKSQIFVMNADGTNMVQLTKDGATDPCFSPDGKHIAYASGIGAYSRISGYDWRIFVMNADGTQPRKLANGLHPTWAPGFVPAPKTR